MDSVLSDLHPLFSSSQFVLSLLNNLSVNAGLYLSSAQSQVCTHSYTHIYTHTEIHYLEISNDLN